MWRVTHDPCHGAVLTMSAHAAASVERTGMPGRSPRLELTGTWLLSAAMAAAGLLAYAFHILAARTLTTDEYGQIAALWAALFIAVVVLFRPLEQTTSRAVADRLARGQEATTVLRSVAVVYLCVLGALAIAAALAWRPLTNGLFSGTSFLTAMLFVGIAGYGVQYVTRGILGGMRRFRGLSGIHVADGSVRLLVALPLVAVASTKIAALALAAAGLLGAVVPLWRSRAELGALRNGASGQRFEMRAALCFAAPAMVIAGSDQLLVNGAPLLVIGAGGADAMKTAAVVFAATMLVRVPVFLFSGVAGSFLPNLARLNAADDHGRFISTVTYVCLVFAATTVAIVAAAATFGPEGMRLLYGPAYEAPASDLALLGLGAGCYLASSTISQALLATARASAGAVAWAVAAAIFVAVVLVSSGDDLRRVSLGVAAGMATSTVLLAVVFFLRTRARANRGVS
jgi:O-antigen/teichoic acid export membrane protein